MGAAEEGGQIALFGRAEVDPSLSRAERAAAAKAEDARAAEETRAAWVARFERVEMDAPWRGEGAVVLGWKCPDCGQVESNEFLLGNNHGWHPGRPGWIPYAQNHDGRCSRQRLLDAHAAYDARRAMIRHLITVGLDDEQIAAQIGFWVDASVVARYRQDEVKAARLAKKAARGEVVTVGHGSDCPCVFCGGTCTCLSCIPPVPADPAQTTLLA